MISLSLFSYSQGWVKAFGGEGQDQANGIITDSDSNIYISGRFYGESDFDPTDNEHILSSNGDVDIYIQKLDKNGELLWVRSFGGIGTDKGLSIAVDSESNVYCGGHFTDSVHFNSILIDTSLGYTGLEMHNYILMKFNSEGELIWVKSIDVNQTDQNNMRGHIIVNSDAIYSIGMFEGTVDFDSSIDSMMITSNGGIDYFIQKMDLDGNQLWTKAYGSIYNDFIYMSPIELDKEGNLYCISQFQNEMSVGNDVIYSNGGYDIAVHKLDSDGNDIWVRSFGGSNNEWAGDLEIDANFNVITSGEFYATVDFDPSNEISNLESKGNSDIFVQKFDQNGNLVWVNSFGGSDFDFGSKVKVDEFDNVILVGGYQDQVDFERKNLVSNGGQDIFIVKMDSDGLMTWNRSLGGEYDDYIRSIDVDANFIYLAGVFSGNADLDPSWSGNLVESNGQGDAFVMKLNSQGMFENCNPVYSSIEQVSCDNYISPSGRFLVETGQYTDVVMSSEGCDSIITIDLSINHSEFYGNDTLTIFISDTNFSDHNDFVLNVGLDTMSKEQTGCDSIISRFEKYTYSNIEFYDTIFVSVEDTLNITLSISTDLEEIEDELKVWSDGSSIYFESSNQEGYAFELISITGSKVLDVDDTSVSNSISLNGITEGTYIAKFTSLSDPTVITTKKIVLR
jgi:hypothetical protein